MLCYTFGLSPYSSLRFPLKRLFALLILLSLTGPLAAVTDTPTCTSTPTDLPTPTPTLTITPAVGEGAWGWVADSDPWVTGSAGHSATLSYQAGPTAFPASGGLLTFFFPFGLEAPVAGNFYAAPAYASLVQGYTFNGSTVSVQVRNLAAGASMVFLYGYNAVGASVSTTISPQTVALFSNSLGDPAVGIGAPVSAGGLGVVNVVTPTMTPTITPTFTISATFSMTPTITPTFSITQTFTETPVGALQDGKVYVYPNPFNMQATDKCTIRFNPASDVHITIFNLLGETVRELSSSDINEAQGWAVWKGVDDYLRNIAGGMYFVRVKSSYGVVTKKFTVLN